MTKPVDQTPPVAPPQSTALTTTGSAVRHQHWSRSAITGAGKLITTAANDQTVRNMIGSQARNQIAATVFGGSLVGAIAARVATRSVPGALLVGGALLAKAVYDQRKAKAEAEKLAVKPEASPRT